jgi:colicin import membrane protein
VERESQQRAEQERRDREREAKADAERKRIAEIERKQKEREADDRRQVDARDQKVRESDLKRQIDEEEGQMEIAQSGVVDRYRALIQQHIYRYWNRPPSARPGIECEINITQAPGGSVLSAKIGKCNGDTVVQQSIENAVLRASPLPSPEDPRAFQRNLILLFKPRE